MATIRMANQTADARTILKNPLAAVSGAIHVLGDKLPDPEQQEIVSEILRRSTAWPR
jgi:hypothetical protein